MMSSSSFLPSKKVEGKSTTVPNWLELPRDITANIFQRLDTVTSACLVCPLWWNICKDPRMWRTIHVNNFRNSKYNLVEICRFAIERSCGHAEIIYIEDFGTDDLLECIAKNCSKLRCLGLVNCRSITDKGFSEAVRKLPLLEKLDISFCKLSTNSLAVVGLSCKLLKWLMLVIIRFDHRSFKEVDDNDDEAYIISKTMPGLHHLNIRGNRITEFGLIAILDGCPLLQTLDIRRCYNIDFDGSLMKRCREQIKDFKPANWEYCDDLRGYHSSLLDEFGGV